MSSIGLDASAKPQEDVGEDVIEHLHCHYCKGYLSCSPLRLLPDGHSICGRCEPQNNDVPVYSNLALEDVLAKVTFPCRFQKDGCSLRMLFGHIIEHESVCQYQILNCFVAVKGCCSWEGRISDISKHFSENHQEYWMDETQQFCVVVEEDSKQNLIVFEKQNVLTVIQYSYNSAKKILEYCIQYMPVDVVSPKVFYNIQLHTIADPTPRIVIKNVPYLYQQTNTSAPSTLSKITLEPYLEILENPDIIVFSVNMIMEGVKTLNYDLLKFLKCVTCGIYVTPPLFKDNQGELFCADCGQKHGDCSSYENEKMGSLMDEVDYPCRWTRCNVTRKVDSIRQHEMSCMYRVFNCAVVGCNKIYQRGQAFDHFSEYHIGYKHVQDRTEFNVNRGDKLEQKLFVVTDDEAIIIEFIYDGWAVLAFKQTPPSKSPCISAYVQHESCKWRSVDFYVPNNVNIEGCCAYFSNSSSLNSIARVFSVILSLK